MRADHRWDDRSVSGPVGSLSDLVVVEMAGSTAGAFTAKLLGDLGAHVACIEPPGGAPLRHDPAKWAAWCTSRVAVPAGSAQAASWLARADVVIESSDDEPLGEAVSVDPSGVITVRISPFGSMGPYAGWRGADIVDQAIGGHLYLSGRPDREPIKGPTGQAALGAGVYGAIGAMAALHARRRGVRGTGAPEGSGQRVEVTHHETLAALHQFTDVRYTHAGDRLKRMGNRYAGPGSPIGMYRASDGWMAMTVATAAHGEMLLAIAGLTDLLELPGIESVTDIMVNAQILDPALNGWLATQSVSETVELLQSARLAVGPVLTMRQVLEDPHLAEREWWQQVEVAGRGVRVPGPPFRIAGMRWNARPAPGPAEGDAPLPPVGDRPTATVLTDDDAPTRPLDGLRVLDLTRVWAGPLAARILGELGADVVMVEAPWARTPLEMPPSYVAASHFFPNDDPLPHPWNRQGFVNKYAITKRSIGLDITTPEGHDAFARLVANVDVVIENYSPRVMPNMGFTEEKLHELNPDLVYVTMPGYGRTGPARDYSAYGPVLDSHAGLSTLMGYPEVDAWKCGIAWPDPVAGVHTAFAVLAALWARPGSGPGAGAGGRGTTIEVAQFETAISMISDRLVRAQLDDADPTILGNRHETFAPQGVYRTDGEDRWVALCAADDDAWHGLCSVLGLAPEWRSCTVEERRSRHDEIDAAISAWTSIRSPEQAAAQLQASGVAAAPVADGGQLVEDPHLRDRGFYVDVVHPEAGIHAWGMTCVARLSDTPAELWRHAPLLGQHNRVVLRDWAGLDDDAIDALEASGIVADRPPA